jgi:predicted dehydrogenase
MLAEVQSEPAKPVAANDHIQIALIGAGGQGQGDTKVALEVPGVKLVAVADCYAGRLDHSKELWGDDIFTTRDYSEILARKDIDAVIIGTPDHWHKQVAVDAMKAGKDVYCEKPMIHLYADGPEMIETAHKSKQIIQVGSQRVSSVIYAKAKELLAAGAIGQLNMVTARWDRNSSIGAWAPRPRFPITPNTFSSGASGRPTEAVWLATFSSTSSAEPTSSPARMGPRAPRRPEVCAFGRTAGTCPT